MEPQKVETLDRDTCLTPVKDSGQEIGLAAKGLRWLCRSEKDPARPARSL